MISVALLAGCSSIRQPARVEHVQMPTRGICAHRGASDTHPENTITAFREAIRLGAQMIEFDVATTKDGKLVLMHDRTIDRTTNGSGRPEEWLLVDLKKLDAGSWKNSRFEGEQIPTLGEALDLMPRNIWLNVHLKSGVNLAEKTARLIASKNRLHQAFLACGASAATAARATPSPALKYATWSGRQTRFNTCMKRSRQDAHSSSFWEARALIRCTQNACGITGSRSTTAAQTMRRCWDAYSRTESSSRWLTGWERC